MKIGLDARFLTHPQAGGFKTYTTNLIRALGEVDSANQYVLYVDREAPEGSVPRYPNFTYRPVRGSIPLIGMPFREQVLLRREIARDGLDIMHFLCNTATVALHCPFVVTLHDVIQLAPLRSGAQRHTVKSYKSWAITAYSKWAILQSAHRAARVITVSGYEQEEIIRRLGISSEKVCVTHLAPNSAFAPARPETKAEWRRELNDRYHLPERFLLGVGYEPRKNISLLIQAFAQMAQTYPGLGLVVVAAEPRRRAAFVELVHELGLDARTVVLGGMGVNDLAKLYNLAELFVFPSERESFGLPPLEAMACGTPTIAMRATSIPEVVQDGALLIEALEPSTWAGAIQHLLTDDGARSDLSRRGLRRASMLTWRNCAEKTAVIYEKVVTDRNLIPAEGKGQAIHTRYAK